MSNEAVEITLTGFARALRSAGVTVTADRTQSFLRAAAAVGVADKQGRRLPKSLTTGTALELTGQRAPTGLPSVRQR